MASVQLINLKKAYTKGNLVIDDFNLEIADGEFVVLVGPSGCGKTTILRMIAGLEDITAGDVIIDGNLVNDYPPKERDIAMVFQNYALYPHMNVYSNLCFGLKLRKLPKKEIDRQVKRAANVLGIGGYLKKKPKELSGGERQRVALGRAMVRDPKVFLFDEPLSNLDAMLRVQMRAEIKKLHNELKTTMIYVTHDQVEAMTLGDRIVILKDGIAQQIGSPMDVYQKPSNRFVGSFIGSPAMNIIDGNLTGNVFEGPNIKIELTDIESNSLQKRAVSLGIRPEDISIGDGRITACVIVTEPLGSETIIHIKLADKPLVIKYPQLVFYQPGEQILISFDLSRIMLFDGQTGNRL